MPAAIVMLLLLAVPVSAQEGCGDSRYDGGRPFECRRVVVTISADADATIEEIIDRSAPGAEILSESEAPDGSGTDYILRVAERSEWDTVLVLRDDPDVATAGLIDQELTPDTAMEAAAPHAGVLALLALVSVAFIGATAMQVRARQR
jgi:hypothetical protein